LIVFRDGVGVCDADKGICWAYAIELIAIVQNRIATFRVQSEMRFNCTEATPYQVLIGDMIDGLGYSYTHSETAQLDPLSARPVP
jgi:hypothetical protein